MTDSFVFLRLELVERRFKEIDILLGEANKNSDLQNIYTTLCRSAHVLLVAHFEGLIKDITKDILDDLNSNLEFKNAPQVLKRTFCEHFLKRDEKGNYDENIKNKLVDAFDELPTKFKVEPFLFDRNKNPSPQMLQSILTKFGIKNFLWCLDNSDLDKVFENNKSDIDDLINRIKFHLNIGLRTFPYTTAEEILNLDPSKKNLPQKKSLWDTFLEDLLKNRHSIVHGQTLDNPTDHEEIEMAKKKVEILLYAFIIFIGKSILRPSSRQSLFLGVSRPSIHLPS